MILPDKRKKLIYADALDKSMYHEAFETDTDMQKWDSGCWIRYKLFEECIDATPAIDAVPVVRCKDCKHWGMHKHLNVPWCFETHIDKAMRGTAILERGKRMRPIDADALLKWLSEWELQEAPWWGANGYGDAKVAETIKEAIDAVEQMPTIDVVPVVRCKDCKHRPIDTGGHNYGQDLFFPDEEPVCPCQCGDPWYSWMPGDDWFCANGEK